jgi:hypothetical protein
MNRQIRIATALTLAALLLMGSVSLPAAIANPLLSGYGGPGAGEQAIVGSTLLSPRGGSGSGGTAGGSSALGSGAPNGSAQAGGGGEAGRAGGVTSTPGSSSSVQAPSNTRAARQPAGRHGSAATQTQTYSYPHASASSAGSSTVLGISSDDMLPLVGIVALLALIGALTLRLARLQPYP